MIKCNFRKSILGKVINLFLVFTFSCYGVVFATPVAEVKTDAPAVVKTATPADVSVEDIGVAIDCGTVKDRYKGKNDKVIIHIQDAHCNFEAQSNINKMLDQFVRECGVDMISVEGAEGIVDTTWFKAFPDAEIRKEVATYFMKKGEITGAEFFSITSDYAGTIYGAETREYYVKNLKAFTKTYPYKTTMETYLKDVRTVANRVKDTIYPAPLKELDTKIRGFKDKTVQLSEFAAYLNIAMGKNGVALKIYPNFEKLVNTLEYEKKINFDIVDQERSQFIDYLGKKLTKKGMAELVAYSIKFKKGHIEAVDFYSFLREKAKEFNIPMLEKFPNLFYYYLYTKIYSGINNEKLFKELDAIEIALKNILIKDDTQRALDKYSRMLDMYINLINIELTNDDYDIFKNDTKDTKIEDVVNFLGKMCDKYNMNYSIGTVPSVISDNIPNMVEFYEVAMKRDNTIIDNTLNEMEKENKKVSVLITGGFHTRGMKSLLESKGISYVVVMPKITKDVETPYIQVLTNQRTSIEDIITENALPGAAMPGSKKDATNQTAKGEMLAPLCRIAFTVGLFVNNDARLKEWSEAIGQVEATGAETVEEHARALFGQIVERFTREWLGEVSAKMVETYGEKAAEEQWAKFLQDDEYWNILFSIYVSKYAEYKGPILESTVALVTGIAKEKFDEYRKTKSPGEGTMRQAIHKGMLTDEEKTATDKAIAATIKSGQAEDVSAANGVFVVLGDKEYYKNAKAVGAPLDVLCVPGTRGTRQQFAEGKIGYDKVDKRFYILQSQFDKLLDAQKEIVAGHEEMHIKISLGIVVPQYAPGQTEEEWINAYEGGRYDIRPIMAAQGSILHMENMIFTDRRFGQAAKDHIVSMREDVSKTWEVSPDVLNDVAETVFYQEMILGQNASQSRRAVNEVLQSVNAKNVQEGMRKFEELQDFIRETYAMYYATETES
ncbi:MAG TPA: hypothetical protein PKG81_00845, partial [Candidatus Omnitrophota bacterium]|nr:hypothetical protein [Candidatus Omnitrophota bacterium]